MFPFEFRCQQQIRCHETYERERKKREHSKSNYVKEPNHGTQLLVSREKNVKIISIPVEETMIMNDEEWGGSRRRNVTF